MTNPIDPRSLTTETIATLTGVELARNCAAGPMGWKWDVDCNGWKTDGANGSSYIRFTREKSLDNGQEFRPDIDHNHANELARKMMLDYPGVHYDTYADYEDVIMLIGMSNDYPEDGPPETHLAKVSGNDIPIATCRVSLLAYVKLEGGAT